MIPSINVLYYFTQFIQTLNTNNLETTCIEFDSYGSKYPKNIVL